MAAVSGDHGRPVCAPYNSGMTVNQLNEVLHAQPFRPFKIHMGDGRAFLVKHRDFISRSQSGRTVIVHTGDDGFSILDMLLVTELEVPGNTRRSRGSR